ncbi:MAG: DNA polymerase III subunit gamma/tau [Clostridia bacterium]|nr:DNA polymerase III subunit gamma/tau [Clostridia bacterium]
MYLALYRKYRPQNFDEMIGQKHIVQTLVNQIKNDKIGHAYLFCGSRGTGKTSTAKIFARAINCMHPKNGNPCEECEACRALKASNNIDILEIDAASNNGVDEIRDLREKVKYPPVNGKYKVYIIDEVHMLSPSAFNALLKTLEEPPAHAVFILATTEVHKLPATILSRCLRFDFGLLSVEELSGLLKKIFKQEGITAEDSAIEVIARAGEGSVRDTLSIADRCVSYSGDNLTFKNVTEVLGTTERESLFSISEILLSGNLGGGLLQLDSVLSSGKSPLVLSKDLISYFRDLLVIITLKDKAKTMIAVPDEIFHKMLNQAKDENYNKIVSFIYNLSEVEAELRYSISPRIVLETAIIKTLSEVNLLSRVERIEKMLDGENVSVASNNMSDIKKQVEGVKAQVENNNQFEKSIGVRAQKSEINTEQINTVAEKVAKVEEVEPQSSQNVSDNRILGELLNFVKDKKEMSLLAILRQTENVSLSGKMVIIEVDDKMTKDLILRDKYKPVLSEFFETRGLTYSVIVKEVNEKKGNIDALSSAFDGKLTIKE